MDELPAYFSSARRRIEPILMKAGFRLATLRYDPEVFESAYAEYTRSGSRFRLVWDGKEGALYGEARTDAGEWEDPEAGQWNDVETPAGTPPKPFDKDCSAERLERLAAAVKGIYLTE